MKHLKKIVSLLLTAVMVLAMCIPVMADAATRYTITAPNNGHTYEIYQIFTGDLHEGTLSNVKWGFNGKENQGDPVDKTILDELTAANTKTDTEKIDIINKYVTLTNPVATIKNDETYSAEPGYYLIKDKDNSISGEETYTKYIVKVSKNLTITPKADKPSFEKKLKDTNDTTGETSGWQDSADYDIGDEIPFQLKGTVASDYDNYKTYYFAFHDVEEAGLTFDKNTVKVYVDGTEISTGYIVKTDANKTHNDCTFEVEFTDLKNIESVHAGSVITVEYKSILNSNAVLGEQGNVNKAKLEFSNNPNNEQVGRPTKPGETPWDNVIVFTYKVLINKTDKDGNALSGAEFTLEKEMQDGSKKKITVIKSESGTTFEFKGLDDGNYILTETKTPDKYNTIDPIKFTVTANHDITWEEQTRTAVLTKLSGNKVDGEITFTEKKDEGSLEANVVNMKGSQLPETGGIGTTIFYVVGVILMLGAGVLLVTKKRMSSNR